jgi:glutathione S-transferase
VRIVLAELDLDYEKTEEITTTTAEDRRADAATLQVPALVDGHVQLWDSIVIIEYLLATYPTPRSGSTPFVSVLLRKRREIKDRLQLATLQTLGASITTISQLKWSGVGEYNAHVARNSERVRYLVEWCETQLHSLGEGFVPGYVSVQDVLLASYLMFLDKRPLGVSWKSGENPKTQALLARMEQRPSFIDNPVWWWVPGIIGYKDDGMPLYE